MENILSFIKNIQKNKNSNQVSLFGEAVLEKPEVPLIEVQPASKGQHLNWEKELLGLYVSGHPALEYQPYIEKVALPLNQLSQNLVGQKIQVGGVIQKVQKILTKNQQTMYFVILEDMKGKIELLVFPKVLERIASLWEEEKVIIAEGRLSDKDGAFKLIVDDAKEINRAEIENHMRIEATKSKHKSNEYTHEENEDSLGAPAKGWSASGGNEVNKLQPKADPPMAEMPNKLVITLPNDAKPEMIHKLSDFFNTCKDGNCKVFLHHQTNKLEIPFAIEHDAELLEKVQEIIQDGKVEVA
jgi:DNA polymerase III alpha subunit